MKRERSLLKDLYPLFIIHYSMIRMFTNLLFLLLIVLLVSFTPGSEPPDPSYAVPFFRAMALYGALLLLIVLQNKLFSAKVRRNKNAFILLVNLELIGFFCLYQYAFEAYRFIGNVFQTPNTFLMLALYWVGLAVFHYTAFNQKRVHPNSATATPRNEVSIQLWMSIPFAIPFLAFTLLFDALQFIPNAHFQEAMKNGSDDVLISIVLMVGMLAFMVLTMIFLPALIQKLWRCEPLEEGPLKDRLEALCRKANFKHAGMKTWTLLNDALTAAIIGIVPRYRYVMFTKRILHELPPESIEAILAHEIGHSYRKHLLIYPGIIMGMFIFASLFFLVFGDFFNAHPLATYIAYALILALYFRFVFGFFSRNFERQADLHIFELGMDPKSMIEALDQVGTLSGNIHFIPNWHHFGIQQRIDFLRQAELNPPLIARHHRFVRTCLLLYFILLAAGLLILFFV